MFNLRKLMTVLKRKMLLTSATDRAMAADLAKGMAAYEAGDYQTAVQELRPLAEAGDSYAQFNLGQMYRKGHGVPQDYAEAAKWFHRAAEAGDAGAQNNLGVMYNNGQGVPQNYISAHMWYNLAASNGNNLAAENRNLAAENRDAIASEMSKAAVERAQARAAQCLASDYQDCGG